MTFTLAAERAVASPGAPFLDDGSATLVFTNSEPFAVIALGSLFVRTRLLPATDRADVKVTLLATGGRPGGRYGRRWPVGGVGTHCRADSLFAFKFSRPIEAPSMPASADSRTCSWLCSRCWSRFSASAATLRFTR